MYSELDEGVADIVSALKFRGMWDESLLAFASDKCLTYCCAHAFAMLMVCMTVADPWIIVPTLRCEAGYDA